MWRFDWIWGLTVVAATFPTLNGARTALKQYSNGSAVKSVGATTAWSKVNLLPQQRSKINYYDANDTSRCQCRAGVNEKEQTGHERNRRMATTETWGISIDSRGSHEGIRACTSSLFNYNVIWVRLNGACVYCATSSSSRRWWFLRWWTGAGLWLKLWSCTCWESTQTKWIEFRRKWTVKTV